MLLSNRYNILQKLGNGGCGEVFLAEDIQLPSKPRCVVKQFKPSTNNATDYQFIKEKFEKEAEILEILGHHDQIPQLYAFFEENGELYIVEQYIEGLTLKQKVAQDGAFNDNFVRDFLVCLLPVISYIHSENIIHRDIKPENIILRKQDGMPVLIDFGVVKDIEDTIINNQVSQTQIISRGYTAPEQATGFPVFASDLFSLGMTAIFMLTGKKPTNFVNPQNGDVEWEKDLSYQVNDELRQIMKVVINADSNERFENAVEMQEAVHLGTSKFFAKSTGRNSKIYTRKPEFRKDTPYMTKVLLSDTETMIKYFYLDWVINTYPVNSDEYQRYLNWKVFVEKGGDYLN